MTRCAILAVWFVSLGIAIASEATPLFAQGQEIVNDDAPCNECRFSGAAACWQGYKHKFYENGDPDFFTMEITLRQNTAAPASSIPTRDVKQMPLLLTPPSWRLLRRGGVDPPTSGERLTSTRQSSNTTIIYGFCGCVIAAKSWLRSV